SARAPRSCTARATRSSRRLCPGGTRSPSCAPQEALRHLDRAFARFFARVTRKQAGTRTGTLGYPKRTSRKRGLGAFRLTGTIVVFSEAIPLPRLSRLRLKERGYYLPTRGTPGVKLRSAPVSEHAEHWHFSVQIEQEHAVPTNAGPVVGV